jgi:hypothetical protein
MSEAPAQILDTEKPAESSAITGCIDAISGDRVFGWAWDPERTTARVGIRVEVEGKSVATAIADQPREDLATNGVGDGAHAFEATLPAGIPPEKIAVFAICPDTGERFELTLRPVEGSPETDGKGEGLRGAVHTLYRSQRALHGRFQSLAEALEGLRKDNTAKPVDNSVAQRLETMEVAIARIDKLLSDQGTTLAALKERPRDQISRVLAYAAVILAAGALIIALWG